MGRPTFTVTQSIVISLLVSTASVAIYRITFGGPAETSVVIVEAPPRPEPPPPAEVLLDCPAPVERPAVRVARTDDARTKRMFAAAVEYLRDRDEDEGCALLRRIVTEKPDTIWAEKARALSERRCDE